MNAPTLVVVWRVTERCDLACPFCAYSRSLARSRSSAHPSELVRVGRLLGEYSARKSGPVLVSWLGGEPLAWPPLLSVSRQFKRDFGLDLGVTTNGVRLADPAVREALQNDFYDVTISLDGLAATHDRLRGRPGLWERTRDALRRMVEHRASTGCGPRLRINTILMRQTLSEFEGLCEMAADLGVDELTFNALGGRDRPEFYAGQALSPADLDDIRDRLEAVRVRVAPRGLVIRGGPDYLARLRETSAGRPWPVADCGPGQAFWFIDEHGWAAPCSFTSAGYGLSLRELRTVADLESLPERFAELQRNQRLAICDDCPSTQVFGKFARVAAEAV